mgnify:CR=1 FL=1|jgi:hypothetical protein
MAGFQTIPRVRVGAMSADQLGDLVGLLDPYRQHPVSSRVLPRAVRFIRQRGQPAR